MTISYQLKTLKETKKLAQVLAQIAKPNLFLLLNGPLGVGKTQLAKLVGMDLGVGETIISPTFVILNQYETKATNWKLVHVDAYRLTSAVNFHEFWELMVNNFTIIEWAENLALNWENQMTVVLNFSFEKNSERKVTIITTNLSKADNEILSKIKF